MGSGRGKLYQKDGTSWGGEGKGRHSTHWHPAATASDSNHAREGDRRGMRGKGRAGEKEEEEERKKERMEDGEWNKK